MVALESSSSSTAYALVPLSLPWYCWWLQLFYLTSHLLIHYFECIVPTTVQLGRHDHLGLPPILNLNQEFVVITTMFETTFPLHLLQSPYPAVPSDAFIPLLFILTAIGLLIWAPTHYDGQLNMGNHTNDVHTPAPNSHASLLRLLSLFLISMEGSEAKFSKSILNSTMHLHRNTSA